MPLSEKQNMYLAIAWRCFEAEPKIDYQKFADEAGLASAASARELLRVTKNKLKAEYGSLSAGLQDKNASGTPKKKASPRKRKVQAGKEGGVVEEEEDLQETPSSVKKARKGKTGGGAVEEADGEVGEEREVAVKSEVTGEDDFFS